MEEPARLNARIASLTELRGLFSAMQALAASRMLAAQSALGGIRGYTEEIEQAITAAASLQAAHATATAAPEPARRSVLLIVAAEHGFTGAFNRQLLERGRREIAPADTVVIVGRRGANDAAEFAIAPAATLPMATQVDGVLVAARRVAARLADYDQIRAVFGRYSGIGRFEPDVRQILPPSPDAMSARKNGALPLHQLPPRVLLSRLVGELLLAELMLVLTESFASENAARLGIMQAANHNVGKKLQGLIEGSRRQRQEAITAELLEVVAGGDAVTGATGRA